MTYENSLFSLTTLLHTIKGVGGASEYKETHQAEMANSNSTEQIYLESNFME